jgi:zinc/manganese transport system substrate-binding protein
MRFIAVLGIVASLWGAASAEAKLKVVTTTEDLAALAQAVGGDRIEVSSIAKGYQDPHFVEAKPSYLLRLRNADLLIAVGLELEVVWLSPLLQQSRNPKLLGRGPGYLDASSGCDILERKTGGGSRAEGDVHPFGNPHYWLDPGNGRTMAGNIAGRLSELSPADAPYFRSRLEAFRKRLDEAAQSWEGRMRPYRGTKVVTYHNSWPNFLKRFGLEAAGFVESKPGVPASPAHTLDLIQTMKAQGVRVILVEPYFDLKTPTAIARETVAKVVVLCPSVGGADGVKDYFQLFEHDIGLLEAAFREGAR